MKSRDLSIPDFLRILQLEYFSFKLRSLIFDKPEFVKMNRDIAEKKKEKILLLAERFDIFTIFDSKKRMKEFYENHFLQEFGLPNLQYCADETKKERMIFWDRFYLLKKGTCVDFQGKIFLIKEHLFQEESIIVHKDGSNLHLPYPYIKLVNLLTQFEGELI